MSDAANKRYLLVFNTRNEAHRFSSDLNVSRVHYDSAWGILINERNGDVFDCTGWDRVSDRVRGRRYDGIILDNLNTRSYRDVYFNILLPAVESREKILVVNEA